MSIDRDRHIRLFKPETRYSTAPAVIFAACVLIILLMMTSCRNDALYDNTRRIPRSGWIKKEMVRFEVPVSDTVNPYKFYLNIRHSTDYRYSNVYFFINTVFPDGRKGRDTVECILARPDGKWLGRGISGTRDNQVLLRVGLRFPMRGTYLFEFEQAMREDTLVGISDIGLRLVRD